jgi:hypothetical protein
VDKAVSRVARSQGQVEYEIQYCPTDAMLGDYMSKPLIGTKFLHFRKMILGLIAFINPG